MKRYKAWIAALTLCSVLLTGCGSRTAGPADAATAGNAVTAGNGRETAGSAVQTTATPVPPSTVPDTPAPEKNGLYELLCGVFDDLHFGTAGSSLAAARYAADLVDWGVKNGTAAIRAGASAWDRGMTNEYGEDLTDKLTNLYAVAFSFYGRGTGVLSDSGWEGEWNCSARDVHRVFQELFPALGAETPLIAAAFFPDEEALYLRAQGVALDEEDMSDPVKALNTLLTYHALPQNAAVLSETLSDGVLTLDMNDAFAAFIRSMGTSGEMLTMAAVVNTALALFDGAESVIITVNGGVLETGHEIYDQPMTFYEEQPI